MTYHLVGGFPTYEGALAVCRLAPEIAGVSRLCLSIRPAIPSGFTAWIDTKKTIAKRRVDLVDAVAAGFNSGYFWACLDCTKEDSATKTPRVEPGVIN